MKHPPSSSNPELFPYNDDESASSPSPNAPLAVRMRPTTLDEVAGQEHLLDEGKLLRRTIQADRLTSIIFYGPPGTGKTSLAKVISRMTKAHFIPINAVTSNVEELRRIISQAKTLKSQGKRTLVFIDEIHRFNKAQQDVLMPYVEEGTITIIGATTYNPSFVINGPLLSRTLIFELNPLEEKDIATLIRRALQNTEHGLGRFKIKMEEDALHHLIQSSLGDARRALNALEIGVLTTPPDKDEWIHFTRHVAEESCQRKMVYHDREGDYHYDIASAFIKSMRGSDPDAAVYWLAKMIYAGEDPRFIIRRILILASEDIGNADPQALILATAGLQAIEFVGMPEAQIILGHLVTYMALAPKSNASYLALSNALKDIREEKIAEVPTHLKDRHYPGAERLGHGEGYKYAHDYADHFVVQEYFPKDRQYYHPTSLGFEKVLLERLQALQKKKSIHPSPENSAQ